MVDSAFVKNLMTDFFQFESRCPDFLHHYPSIYLIIYLSVDNDGAQIFWQRARSYSL